MLTKSKNPIRGNWKYVAILPALLACTFVLAQTKPPVIQTENTTFKGMHFEWSKASVDSLFVIDPISGEESYEVHKNPPVIVKANETPVYTSETVNLSAVDREHNRAVVNDLTRVLLRERSEIPDSIARIQLRNVVLSPQGKIVYYEAFYSTDRNKPAGRWYSSHPVLDPMLDKIIEDGDDWEPALKDGKPVYEFSPEFFTLSI